MDYRIRGLVETAREGGYTAIAQAVPPEGGSATELRQTYTTRLQAVEGMRSLAVRLGAMIRAQGDDVIDVKTED